MDRVCEKSWDRRLPAGQPVRASALVMAQAGSRPGPAGSRRSQEQRLPTFHRPCPYGDDLSLQAPYPTTSTRRLVFSQRGYFVAKRTPWDRRHPAGSGRLAGCRRSQGALHQTKLPDSALGPPQQPYNKGRGS